MCIRDRLSSLVIQRILGSSSGGLCLQPIASPVAEMAAMANIEFFVLYFIVKVLKILFQLFENQQK